MKKILIAILLLGMASYCYAEVSASGMSGTKYTEQQVFVTAYNNSGADISSNYVVVLDTTAANAASGSLLGTCITTTTTANDPRVFGVTDETIVNGTSGRVCIRGPHKCYLLSTGATGLAGLSAGATLATTATAGAAGSPAVTTSAIDASPHSVLGILLHTGVIGYWNTNSGYSASGGSSPTEGSSNYWIWVGKR